MTDLRKAAEMALNALKISTPVYSPHKFTQALKALEAALAQSDNQEPVAHLWECIGRWSSYLALNGEKANLAPPEWLVAAVKAATAQPEPQVCCGDYEKCMKPCTPRGRWLANQQMTRLKQEKGQFVGGVPSVSQQREWVGLTDKERNEMIGRIQHDQYTRQRDLIGKTQIITEMYLKEKNT